MNSRQLQKIGVPTDCTGSAMRALGRLSADAHPIKGILESTIKEIMADPAPFKDDKYWGEFARDLTEMSEPLPPPIEYSSWLHEVDEGTHKQMQQACELPVARAAALMPDAHLGYGLPIGGVLACENAVIPYAVGVDIACRMKLSILDTPVTYFKTHADILERALVNNTKFGVGVSQDKRVNHDVMDMDWSVSKVTRERKDIAFKQLGTSGSGNHFVEFGIVTIPEQTDHWPGYSEYVAILSHSGSRGTGAAVCSTYSGIARSMLPTRYKKFEQLAWLPMDSEAGQEYWAAMNLMGEYAAANHAIIHELIVNALGARVIKGIENHHNFAWKEMHFGKELIVHRKGATPAGLGVSGIIPGTMADPAYIVQGLGNPASLASASHGAGRRMSRKKANETYRFKAVKNDLVNRGIRVISAGSDEVPGAYKDIREVMKAQSDLVSINGTFQPMIVQMCGDDSKAED